MKRIGLVILILFYACSSGKKVTVLSYNEAIQQNDKGLESPELRQDARFLVEARSYGMLLAEMSKLAATNAYAGAVQEFAKELQQDVSKLNTQIVQLAANTKVRLADKMSPSHEKLLQDLNEASRREFDRIFIRTTERVYEDNIDMYKDVATGGHNDEVRAFAARQLSMLRTNQRKADELENELI